MLQTWCWLMSASFLPCRLASLRDYRRPSSKLRHSTGPLPSCLQENCLFSTDMTKKLPTLRTMSGREEEETRKYTPNTPLRCLEVILHNSKNKNLINNILCSYPIPHNIQLVNMLDCVVTLESGGRKRPDHLNPQ